MAFFSLTLAITLAILYSAGCSPSAATGVDSSGSPFIVDLIHRDSVKSPFYDHSMTFSQRIGHALQRSVANAKRYKDLCNRNRSATSYRTQIIPDHGEFLLNISFGNPSHKVLAIADTGSDLSWIQCKPCIQCYKHTGLLFDPKKSSTYKPVGCKSTTCTSILSVDTSCSPSENCQFYASYADGSFSNGSVSTETIRLGDRFLPNIVFGCGFSNDGVFRPTWGGVVGLGGGHVSLVSQILSFVPPKFSYCLIPYPTDDDGVSNKSSKMIFGDILVGPNTVYTPLIKKSDETFYYVTLKGISVGNTRLDVGNEANPEKALEKGNMIVDSGTTLTMLPEVLYKQFEKALKDALNLRTMKDPQKVLSLCYRNTTVKEVPKVTVHFEGADVELSRDNLFVTVSKHIICLAFSPTLDSPVYGNLAQMNFIVGFDIGNKMVSFKPTDCQKM